MYLKQVGYKYNLNFEEFNNEEIKLKFGQTVITSNKEFIVIGCDLKKENNNYYYALMRKESIIIKELKDFIYRKEYKKIIDILTGYQNDNKLSYIEGLIILCEDVLKPIKDENEFKMCSYEELLI